MNKILFSADPDINYVFHMLSVAKCGYDNALYFTQAFRKETGLTPSAYRKKHGAEKE